MRASAKSLGSLRFSFRSAFGRRPEPEWRPGRVSPEERIAAVLDRRAAGNSRRCGLHRLRPQPRQSGCHRRGKRWHTRCLGSARRKDPQSGALLGRAAGEMKIVVSRSSGKAAANDDQETTR